MTRSLYRHSLSMLVVSAAFGFSANCFAQYQATAYVPNGTVLGSTTVPGDVSYAYDNGSGSTAVVAFTSNPVASVSFTATAFNPLGQISSSGGGIMTYRFQVEAQPFTNVPIDFSGLYSSYQGAAGSVAGTSFTIQTLNSSVSTYATFQSYFYGNCGAPSCLHYTTFNNTAYTSMQSDPFRVEGSFDGTFNMLTGADGKVIGSVQLFAGANVNVGFVSASAAAFIDPRLEIDAAFLAANPGAILTLTEGVGNEIANVTAVPEPTSYALMLAGLFAVMAVVRRRNARNGDSTRR